MQQKLKEIEEEEKRIESLRESAKLWKEAEMIRDFITTVQHKNLKEKEWIVWAAKIADCLDPLE